MLSHTIASMVAEFQLSVGEEVAIYDSRSLSERDKHAAFAAVYFGSVAHEDVGEAREIMRTSAPIIPTVSAEGDFSTEVPEFLRTANGLRRRNDDPELTELAAAILECVGLLRR